MEVKCHLAVVLSQSKEINLFFNCSWDAHLLNASCGVGFNTFKCNFVHYITDITEFFVLEIWIFFAWKESNYFFSLIHSMWIRLIVYHFNIIFCPQFFLLWTLWSLFINLRIFFVDFFFCLGVESSSASQCVESILYWLH